MALGVILPVLAAVLVEIEGKMPQPAPVSHRPLARAAQIERASHLTVTEHDEIMVEGASALARNAAIPISPRPIEEATGFHLSRQTDPTFRTALKCLTQAIYYEAGSEPMQGQRAVAQIVLNRVRHPFYPKTVCGVVYQGWQRTTGCQFSFVCDASLLRTPAPDAWRVAETIARAALAGKTEPSVGTATHYHADYVLPQWAFELSKIGQLGRHIFYRFDGYWGGAAALSGRYRGSETIPPIDFAALRIRGTSVTGPTRAEAYLPDQSVEPDVKDRHAPDDVGGRLDPSKQWRLTLPDSVMEGEHYRQLVSMATKSTPDAIQNASHPTGESTP